MRESEAEQVLKALERGKTFEWSSYHPGVREVLEYCRADGRFVLTAHYAHEPYRVERTLFTRDELDALLRERFSYKDFGLPPVEGGEARRHGRRLNITSKSDDTHV